VLNFAQEEKRGGGRTGYLVWWVLAGKASELRGGPEQLGVVGRPAAAVAKGSWEWGGGVYSSRESGQARPTAANGNGRRKRCKGRRWRAVLPWLLVSFLFFFFFFLLLFSSLFCH